jgi:hypothetical protein
LSTYVKNTGFLDPSNTLGGVAPDFTKRGGITSSLAAASAASAAAGNPLHYGLAVIDGQVSDALTQAGIPNGPNNNSNGGGFQAIPTSQVLVAPLLYGDFNGDGVVNDTDITVFIGLGQYGSGPSTFGWIGGDLNGDGVVDDTDLTIFIASANYGPGTKLTKGITYSAAQKAAFASQKLTANTAAIAAAVKAAASVAPAATTLGSLGDGTLGYKYDPTTGDVQIVYNGDTRITTAAPLQIAAILTSGGTTLVSGALNSNAFSNTTYNSTTLRGSQLSASIPDGYDLGNILSPGLSQQTLLSTLLLQFYPKGSLAAKTAELIAVPEPTTLSLIGVGAAGLLARRRRKAK